MGEGGRRVVVAGHATKVRMEAAHETPTQQARLVDDQDQAIRTHPQDKAPLRPCQALSHLYGTMMLSFEYRASKEEVERTPLQQRISGASIARTAASRCASV